MNKTKNPVSVVIPVHNRVNHLIKSVYFLDKWNSFDIDLEIIISDDNSTEDVEGAFNYLKEICNTPLKFTRYSYSDKPHLFRLSKARNEGCKLAEKEFLLIIDGDRILEPNYINKNIKLYLSSNKEIVIGGRTIYLKTNPEEIGFDCNFKYLRDKELTELESQDRALPSFARNSTRDITDRRWHDLYGGGIFIKRDLFNNISGYNEEYEGYGHEDNDFALRIKRSGARIILNWNSVMYHLNHPVYHSEYDLEDFRKAYGKDPFDFTLENRKRYSDTLTLEETNSCKF